MLKNLYVNVSRGPKGKVKTGGMEGLEGQKTFLGIFARWTLEEIGFIEKSF